METFVCSTCGETKPIEKGFGTGYGTDAQGQPHCYACCAELDRQTMHECGHIVLYLTKNAEGRWEVKNWPGTLRFSPLHVQKGGHNIARHRYDAWFVFAGHVWHGVNIGDNELLRCKRTKATARGALL